MAFSLYEKQGVTYLASDCLMARHAFSTRLGGVSDLPHTATLNLAFGRGDEAETVRENLRLLGAAAGFDPAAVISVPQVHGRLVHVVDRRHGGMGYESEAAFEGDGYVTTDPGVTPGVKTADCTPILLEARAQGTPVAVAALHAGWKGTVSDIAGEGARILLREARQMVGDADVTVHAAIGPCIHPCCFEVKEDCLSVARASLAALPHAPDLEAFVVRQGERTALDLPALNRDLLIRAGVSEERIDVCPLCTCCHPHLFYSHRATGGVRGTLLSVITL